YSDLNTISTLILIYSSFRKTNGLISHERTRPFNILSLLKVCRAPSFLTTIKGDSSTLSNVVKRNPHDSHSLLLLIAVRSSACLESTTLELSYLQFGHLIRFTSQNLYFHT